MRLVRNGSWCLALALLVSPLAAKAEGPLAIKDGDRIVFYGDSITDQRQYTVFTETYLVTRFPKLKLEFIHSGWGGDRVTGGGGGPIDLRLQRDVIAYKPTVMTIMLGMNDASYKAFNGEIFATYSKGYKHILDVLKKELPNLRLTLIRPSPFDDVTRRPGFEGGYNGVLEKYGDFVAQLAKENGATIADLNTSVVEATKKAYIKDPELAKQLNPDRIHPMHGGQLLMAAALLKAWNAPSLVSEVHFDAADAKAVNAKVENVKVDNGVISWTQTDEALPFPINFKDKVTALAVASSTFVDDLNRQMLIATRLEKPNYTLKIDGKAVGKFSKEQLEKGVNLATLPTTPMLEQARNVQKLVVEHNDMHFYRWRSIEVPFEKEDPAAVKKSNEGLDAIEAIVVKHQREAAQPKPHKFELVPQG